MKTKKLKIFHVTIEYNIEADSATKALDQVLGAHIITPLSFSCEPATIDEDEDDF